MNTLSPKLSISIVSHGQGDLLKNLFADFSELDVAYEVLLTINIPEDESFLLEYDHLPIKTIRNESPHGFGENHNHAFAESSGEFFVVVNPDIRLCNFRFAPLLAYFDDQSIGAIAPAVYSSEGVLQDSARKFPTLMSLLLRRLGDSRGDYKIADRPFQVDWVAGMFMVFRRRSFELVGGFDQRYFMYMEDADICRRLLSNGLKVMLSPKMRIVHDAQRASRRKLRYFLWHCKSAAIFLLALNKGR
jgi:GT2 family glycosyltransferase